MGRTVWKNVTTGLIRACTLQPQHIIIEPDNCAVIFMSAWVLQLLNSCVNKKNILISKVQGHSANPSSSCTSDFVSMVKLVWMSILVTAFPVEVMTVSNLRKTWFYRKHIKFPFYLTLAILIPVTHWCRVALSSQHKYLIYCDSFWIWGCWKIIIYKIRQTQNLNHYTKVWRHYTMTLKTHCEDDLKKKAAKTEYKKT